MLHLLTWLLILIPAFLAAEDICSHRPDVTALKNCCKMPNLEFSFYNSKCGQYMVNGFHITPCSFECIFQASGALNGTSLVMENIEKMLKNVMASEEFLQIYVDGFRSCSAQEKAMIKNLKRRRMPLTGKCSSMALMYGLCSHRYFYRFCPDKVWSKSAGCNEAREYSIRCDDQMTNKTH
ncbi:uncharacterized protein LOC108022097 [Drosophila biarmipes]|uniref:uncharacterized protein LOC108022097 n=1 Tax=Drosophila biarmipes TaxID=125945 RepID=UPI0007E67380|nr:uncharacterized protein LOC108022097 [Drosophila biarmipes]